jgi:cell division protease FtsH
MSDSSNNSNRKSNSDRNISSGQVIWYVLLGGMVVLLIGAFVVNNSGYRLEYSDFVRLVQVTKYTQPGSAELAEGFDGKIVINSKTKADSKIELSKLKNIQMSNDLITGKVEYRLLKSDSTSEEVKEMDFRTVRSYTDSADSQLREMLTTANIPYGYLTQSAWGQFGFAMLLMTGLIIFFTYMMLKRISGVGSPMQFGRSRGRLYAQDDNATTFKDVAGIDEAVEEVSEIVDFLKFPDKYQKLGGRIPKGVLLVGPPGTGKTLLAKAIAGEAGVPFFSLSGSDFVEMFVGVGAARVRDMFQQAASKSPCIIFIDELDALGKSRGGNIMGGHDEREQTLNALLVEMDGFDANIGIIVMAATNRPETLDPALLRPGRFDRHVLVDRPDKGGREEILKVHVKNVKLGPDVALKEIASITPGFVGADLANLVNEAALLAARKGKSLVGQEEFNDGVERVTAGLEKKRRVMSEDEKRRVAYHEAGHALLAYSLPNTDPVHKVSIIPRGLAALGYTMQRPEGDRYLMTKSELEAQMQVLLAGTLTEEIVFKDISTGAQNDLERCAAIARSMVMEYGMSRLGRVNYRESNRSPFLAGGAMEASSREYSEQTSREIDLEVKRIIDEAVSSTHQILSERRDALEAVTKRLIEVESIDGEELKRLVEATLPGPRVVPGTDNAVARTTGTTAWDNSARDSGTGTNGIANT